VSWLLIEEADDARVLEFGDDGHFARRVDLIVHLANEGRKVGSFARFFLSVSTWRRASEQFATPVSP